MDIGRIERIIDIEPVIMPVPGVLSDLRRRRGSFRALRTRGLFVNRHARDARRRRKARGGSDLRAADVEPRDRSRDAQARSGWG
jgi:hypothetical protein